MYQCHPDHLDEALRVMREQVAPTMRQQPGFQKILLLAEAKSSRIMSISVWESEEAMRAGERGGGYFQEALSRLAPFFIGSSVVEHYDVTVEDR